MDKNKIQWDIDIKLLSNRFFMKQLYFAFLVPCLFLLILVSVINLGSESIDSFQEYIESIIPIMYISLAFIITPIPIILIFFKNKYPFTFLLDDKKAFMLTRKNQRKRNNVVSNLLIFFGALSGKPGAIGTGLINKGNNDRVINYSQIKKIIFYERQSTIILKGPFPESVYLFCTETICPDVLTFLYEKIGTKTEYIKK